MGLCARVGALAPPELSATSEGRTSDPPSSEQRSGTHGACLSRSSGVRARAPVHQPPLSRYAPATLDHDAQFWTTTLRFGPRRFGLDHDAGTGDAIPSLKTVLESPARGRHTKVRAGLERKFNFLSKP